MPTQISINTLQPEQVSHGTEVTLQVNGIIVGELYQLDWEENQHIEAVTVLGSRIMGRRQGVFEVKGSIKAYWINQGLREMVCGKYPVTGTGQPSAIYHSARPFQRYDIVVVSTNPKTPSCTLKNCVFETDKITLSSEKIVDDDVAFFAEEVFGQ